MSNSTDEVFSSATLDYKEMLFFGSAVERAHRLADEVNAQRGVLCSDRPEEQHKTFGRYHFRVGRVVDKDETLVYVAKPGTPVPNNLYNLG